MNKLKELTAKLREIFQIDRPELDFGVYRIIGMRAPEIEKFLDETLPGKVAAALSIGNNGDLAQKQQALKELISQLQEMGVNPESSLKYTAHKAEVEQLKAGNVDYEGRVYAHLLNFFGRYYDKGDFISKRRYKGDTYAVPYAGEEVLLYWANFDQYYIKSGENFSNYTIKLDDKRKVHFRLISADTAKDNRKDNDLERCFVLAEPRDITRVDEDGNETVEKIIPINHGVTPDEFDDLVIKFEYLPMPKGTKQADLVAAAVKQVLTTTNVLTYWPELKELRPTEKNKERTLLEKALTDYVSKNKADYFIHKDLGKFLRRELDFYIKNEMLHLDDIQHVETFREIEKNLKMIQCMRAVAEELITFMAQLEDFQKKLWLKKKFVTQCDYCITLDRVPEAFIPEILKNRQQWAEWQTLGVISNIIVNNDDHIRTFSGDLQCLEFSVGETEYLVEFYQGVEIKTDCNMSERRGGNTPLPVWVDFKKTFPFLMLDTQFFDANFKARLLAAIPDLDDQCDGLLIHSENFQALNLLQERYREQVKCIYIDPPYNTGDDGFIYKDSYKSSSWLSAVSDRIDYGVTLTQSSASNFISIGDEEQELLASHIRQRFGKDNFYATLIWEKKKKGSFLSGKIAKMKDYILCFAQNVNGFDGLIGEINNDTETYPCINPDNPTSIRNFSAGIPSKYKDGNMFRAKGTVVSAGNMKLVLLDDLIIENFVLKKDVAIEGKWRYSQASLDSFAQKGALYFTQDLYIRRIVSDERRKIMKDLLLRLGNDNNDNNGDYRQYDTMNVDKFGWGTNEDANEELHHILGVQYAASYPKPSKLITLILASIRDANGFYLDYFAGSGTTGHAVINLNREDGGTRKYILVEMGDHFDKVLKPRIQKVVFAKEWKDGKPVEFDKTGNTPKARKEEELFSDSSVVNNPYSGVSHCFKYLRLESYEDTLNNLSLVRSGEQQELLGLDGKLYNEYLLRYMLDLESRGSLLSTDDFKKPFDYMLNIAVDSAGAMQPVKIDLVETFNYLIGLRVKHQQYWPERGICIIEGMLPSGENALILWRDCEKVGYEALNKFCDSMGINPRESIYDVVYINGDNTVANQSQSLDSEGGITKILKLRQIEEEFLSKMFGEV